MRALPAFPAIVLALGLVAEGQDLMPPTGETTVYHTHHVSGGATAAPVAAQGQWQALPHYRGRGEWPGPSPCCQAPDGTVWGSCAQPRSYVMHLWDDYCREKTKCPCCGYELGSLMHYLHCKRQRFRVVKPACVCPRPGSCAGGCAGCDESILDAGHVYGDATPSPDPTPMDETPAPPKPMGDMMGDMMPPMKDRMGKKKEMKVKMKKKPMPKKQEKKAKADMKKAMPEKKEKSEPKAETSFLDEELDSPLDNLPAFLAPLLNDSK